MTKHKIAIIVGTTRNGRYADKPAQWILDIGADRDDLEFELVDLRDYPMALFDEPASPVYRSPTNPVAEQWNSKMEGFAGYIFITAEYNHGIPGSLKNALDHSYREFNRKPASFVGYGGVGGARAVEQLRMVCVELQMAPLRSAVHIGVEPFVATMKGERSLSDFEALNGAAKNMLDELVWWTNALLEARAAK